MSEAAPEDFWSPTLHSASGIWVWSVASHVLRADARFASLMGLDAVELASGAPVSRFFQGIVAEAAAEHLLVELADARLRYLRKERELVREPPLRDATAQMLDQIRGRRARSPRR